MPGSMLAVWLLLAGVLSLALVGRLLSGRTLSHGSMLALGLLLYVAAPFIAYGAGLYTGGPGEEIWSASFERLYARSPQALAVLAVLTAAFLAGHAVGREIQPTRFFEVTLSAPLVTGVLLVLTAAWLLFLFQAREMLFAGYLLGYRPDLMGPLATVNLCALLVFLNLDGAPDRRRLRLAFGALLLANSIALLSMGGRLYAISTLLGVLLQWLNSPAGRRPRARVTGFAGLVAAVLALAAVGIWRLGDADAGLSLGHILLAEPVLTSISLGSLLDCPLVGLLDAPRNYLSSIINFVPSALLPGKSEWMVDLDPSGNCLASPFGATHLGAALLVNFGLAGAALVVAGFALLMRWLAVRPGNWLHAYLCSLLPFMLFRDGFLIFNKAFFATGLLLAAVLVLADRLLATRSVARAA